MNKKISSAWETVIILLIAAVFANEMSFVIRNIFLAIAVVKVVFNFYNKKTFFASDTPISPSKGDKIFKVFSIIFLVLIIVIIGMSYRGIS